MRNFLFFCFLLLGAQIEAQPDVIFVGFNADGTDGIAFLVLGVIPANTTIYFTDNEVDGSGIINTGETFWEWSHTSDVPQGTVVVISKLDVPNLVPLTGSDPTSSLGMTQWSARGTGNNSGISGTDEIVYAYLGSDHLSPTTFLSSIANDGFSNGEGTARGHAIAISGDEDVMVYNGQTVWNDPPNDINDIITAITNSSNWITQDGSGDQSNDGTSPDFPGDIPSFSGSALPITLLSFTAERRGEQALIRWSTSAEEENDYMAVERSQDGISFREIGRVSGAGTTDFVQRYSFLDERPGNGLNYYRLRQVDFDGSFEYHRIATLDFRSGATVGTQVYPNPTKGDIFLSAQLADGAELLLLNTQGQVLRQFDASQAKAQNSLRTASLPAGVYFLRIASGGQAETLRFVKE